MKYSEMNANQKKAFRAVVEAANNIIGGLENDMEDNLPGSEVYDSAESALNNHEALVNVIYTQAVGRLAAREIRFCGSDFIRERAERRVKKMGY